MYYLYSEMLKTRDPHLVELTKIGWVSASQFCSEYGMTVIESFYYLLSTETKIEFDYSEWMELRGEVSDEDLWVYDMLTIERVIKEFPMSVKDQLKILKTLFPDVAECEKIFQCLTGGVYES